MIRNVSIRNFKSLRDVQVELERFTMFVGPNASGKSSILQGLNLLCRAFQPVLRIEYKGSDPTPITTQVLNEDVEVELSEAATRGAEHAVELAANASGTWCRYRTSFASVLREPPHVGQAIREGEVLDAAPESVLDAWKSWSLKEGRPCPLPISVLLRLDASKLIQPTPADPDPTIMAPDGTGLHSALASMALNDPDSWQRLQADLRRVIPTIRRLRHTKSAIPQPPALLFDTVGADSLPAHQVSEGTLLVLGLLAALHASGRPDLILLDDLDRGLHPRAQKELISLLRGLLETNPDLQILATTHSPYMLDCMEPEEVRMTVLRDDGATVCAPLDSHPRFAKWKDEMYPGEMWSLFGEKWLTEQGVAS